MEREELETLPMDVRPEAFFLCWTRKEAYVKAKGEGLQIPLESFNVSLTPGKPAVFQSRTKRPMELAFLISGNRLRRGVGCRGPWTSIKVLEVERAESFV